MTKRLFFLLTLLTCGTLVNAQKGYEIGGFVGMNNYIGEINPNFSFKSPGLSIGAVGRYNFNTRTTIRLDLGAGRLTGKDALSDNDFQKARNLSFRTDYLDAALNFEFNFFPLIHGSKDRYYTPYVFAGLAFVYYNPKAQLDGEWHALRPLGTEGQSPGGEYSSITAGLSYGLGFKIDFSYEWSLNVEVSFRQLGTDYLDDISTTYPNSVELAARRGDIAVKLSDRSPELGIEPIGQPGRQRGTTNDKDSYYAFRVGAVYYIGILQCPAISRVKP